MTCEAWPLNKLLEKNRNAMTVYSTLRWLAGDRRQLNTTRARINEVCGLHIQTISKAISALNESRWITLNYGRHQNRCWYRFTFPCERFFPLCTEKTCTGKGSEGRNKRTQRGRPLCTKKTSALSKESKTAGPRLRADPAGHVEHDEVARLEQKHIAEARRKRLEQEPAKTETTR